MNPLPRPIFITPPQSPEKQWEIGETQICSFQNFFRLWRHIFLDHQYFLAFSTPVYLFLLLDYNCSCYMPCFENDLRAKTGIFCCLRALLWKCDNKYPPPYLRRDPPPGVWIMTLPPSIQNPKSKSSPPDTAWSWSRDVILTQETILFCFITDRAHTSISCPIRPCSTEYNKFHNEKKLSSSTT